MRLREKGKGVCEKLEAIKREKIGPPMEVGRGGGTREVAKEGTWGEGAVAGVIEEWHSPARPT